MFFDELEIFNVSDESISILVGIVKYFFGSFAGNGNLQEFPGVIAKGLEFLSGHLSLRSFRHSSRSMHDLKAHFGTMSLEQKVTLSNSERLPFI
jgi:hypothetical protein